MRSTTHSWRRPLHLFAVLLLLLVQPSFGIDIDSYIDKGKLLGLYPTEFDPETTKDCEELADEFEDMIDDVGAAMLLCSQNEPSLPQAHAGTCCLLWASPGWGQFWCTRQAKCAPIVERYHCLMDERMKRVNDCYDQLERKKKFIPVEDLNKEIKRQEKIHDATMSVLRKTGEHLLKSRPISKEMFDSAMKLVEEHQKMLLKEMLGLKQRIAAFEVPKVQPSPPRPPQSTQPTQPTQPTQEDKPKTRALRNLSESRWSCRFVEKNVYRMNYESQRYEYQDISGNGTIYLRSNGGADFGAFPCTYEPESCARFARCHRWSQKGNFVYLLDCRPDARMYSGQLNGKSKFSGTMWRAPFGDRVSLDEYQSIPVHELFDTKYRDQSVRQIGTIECNEQ